MRLATDVRNAVHAISSDAGLDDFCRAVEVSTTTTDRQTGILLVGGSQPRDLAVRTAQAGLRLDRLPSYWSHAALVLSWPQDSKPQGILGVEVSMIPEDFSSQVPERNGVTLFSMDRYENVTNYPNLCFAAICGSTAELEQQKQQIVRAALNPLQNRLQYRLWEWLGPWWDYVQAPDVAQNPLAKAIPLPSAALCEYAYAAAGLDVTPAATEPSVCPELLWAVFLYWYRNLGLQSADLRVWARIGSADRQMRLPLDGSLAGDFNTRLGIHLKPPTAESSP